MPYDTGAPNKNQSPGLFPAQANDNFTRLKAIIGANHKFNDSSDPSTDGFHQNVQIMPMDTPGANATVGQAYVRSNATPPLNNGQLWYQDTSNNNYQITPTLPTWCAVNFDGTGAVGFVDPAKIRYSYGLRSINPIEITAPGAYTLHFASPLPSANYVVHAIAGSSGGNDCPTVSIFPANYTVAVTNSLVSIGVRNNGSFFAASTVMLTVSGG